MDISVNTNKFKIEFTKQELFEMFQNHEANTGNVIKKGKREDYYRLISEMLTEKNNFHTFKIYSNDKCPIESLMDFIIDEIITNRGGDIIK